MKGEIDILANFPIDTSLKKKVHSALAQWQHQLQGDAIASKKQLGQCLISPLHIAACGKSVDLPNVMVGWISFFQSCNSVCPHPIIFYSFLLFWSMTGKQQKEMNGEDLY